MKIHPMGVEYFHVDSQTDRQTVLDRANSVFRNFAKASKNGGFSVPFSRKTRRREEMFQSKVVVKVKTHIL